MTIARGLALAALVVAIAVVAVVLLRDGDAHEYDLVFITAGQLVPDDDVQVGGRRIGSIKEITLDDDNLARVRVEIEDAFAPLREGTEATIRMTSLSGVANRYITLTMGPNNARALPEGSTIGVEHTTTQVDLDQLFDTFDPETRKGLQEVIQGFATQYDDQEAAANAAAEYFNPALSTTRRVVNELTRDQQALDAFLTNGAAATSALSERSGAITELVSNATAAGQAIAAERRSLSNALGQLPLTLRRANTTFVNLRATIDDLDVLVDASKPATKELAPLMRELRPLIRDARPTVADLRTLIRRPGADDDATDLLRKTPELDRIAGPAFRESVTALDDATPVLEFARPYMPDLVGTLRSLGQNTANYDANGHYARVQPMFAPYTFTETPSGGLLTPRDPGAAVTGYSSGKVARCPGSASQAPADGSAPWRDSDGELDCDPRLVPPGP